MKFFETKTTLLITGLIAIAVFLIIIAIVSVTRKAPLTPALLFSFPTPTPVPVHIEVSNLSIPDNTTISNTSPDISITFTRPLTVVEQTQTHIVTSPPLTGNTTWSNNGQTATLHPSASLVVGQQYKATVTYPAGNLSWNFNTASPDTVSSNDLRNMQAVDDKNFANEQNTIKNPYPWFDKLPIDGQNYHIYFDLTAKAFIIDLYEPAAVTAQQLTQVKIAALTQLKTVIPNANTYPIQTQVISQ